MARINLLGQSNSGFSSNVSYEKTQNFYMEVQSSEETPLVLYPTPGTTLWATVGTGPITKSIVVNGLLIVSSGTSIYSVDNSGVPTLKGTTGAAGATDMVALLNDTGTGYNVLILNGTNGYIYDESTVTVITDADFPDTATSCDVMDGRFVVNDPSDPGRFVVSALVPSAANLINGTGWTASLADYADRDPDNLIAIQTDHRELWLFGDESTEVWYNTANETTVDVPFSSAGSMFLEWGCAAKDSVTKIANNVLWLSKNDQGQGVVLMSVPGNPKVISNFGVMEAISGYTTISDAIGYTMQWKGHNFYVLTFPNANATWVYDLGNGMWFEWTYSASGRHRGNSFSFFAGKHIIGDYQDGNLYYLDDTNFTDNTNTITRLRRSGYIHADGNWVIGDAVEIRAESGVGNDAGSIDADIMLRWSDDGGHTWSNEHVRSMGLGDIGEYDTRSVWRRIGRFRRRLFEIKITDPVKTVIYGAYLKMHPGNREI
jgi:hypothetical protein